MKDKQYYLDYLRSIYKKFTPNIFEEYYSLLDEIDQKEELNCDTNILQNYLKSISIIGAILARNNKYENALRLYRKAARYRNDLYQKNIISFRDKNSFDIMLIKCLNETGNKTASLLYSRIAIEEFFKFYSRIKKECLESEKIQPSDPGCIGFIILSIKDLCRYARIVSNSIGDGRFASYFSYKEKLLELYHYSYFIKEYTSNYILRNEHKVILPHDITFIITGTSLKNIKGKWQKLKYILHILHWLIFSIFSRYIWGFGEKPLRILSNMLLLIFIYAFFYFRFDMTTESSSFLNSLYFSIVTFTSLGYGDIRPLGVEIFRIVASSEAFLGVIFISLFIFTLGRKSVK